VRGTPIRPQSARRRGSPERVKGNGFGFDSGEERIGFPWRASLDRGSLEGGQPCVRSSQEQSGAGGEKGAIVVLKPF
jgi:hypothetical protein